MRKQLLSSTLKNLFLLLIFVVSSINSYGQLTNSQTVARKCYTGPTQSFGNSLGTSAGSVNFVSGADIPAGHKVVDVIVEIEWSKTDDGSCTPTTGSPVDLSHVGFTVRGPVGPTRVLAASANSGSLIIPTTTSSFNGATNVIRDTITFKDGYPSLLPAGLPNPSRDTVRPNNQNLNFYTGLDPYGSWSVGAIDDPPIGGPQLCIHSWCITLVTCDFNSLEANCSYKRTIAISPSGNHLVTFNDIDSASDVSCQVKNMTFSPAILNCSDVGTTIPITMTIRDNLDSIATCVSQVEVVDTIPPSITNCFPTIWGSLYLDASGRDTFWADSVVVIDNCVSIVKEVRPFTGTTWRPHLAFNCVTGFQQFWVKATDPFGNVDSCRIVVNIQDTIQPTAICGRDTAFLTMAPNGATNVSAFNLDGGSFDVCPPIVGRWIGSQYAPPPTYTCADLGIDTVRLIVADLSGNLDTCDNAIVVVMDTIAPTAVCTNDTIYLNTGGNATAMASSFENGSTDTCGIDSMDINGSQSLAFNCSAVNAPQAVTYNVYDFSGNVDSCQAYVYVMDTIPPTANCKNINTYIDGTGTALVYADSLDNGSIDLCTNTNLSFEIAGSNTTTFSCGDIATNPNQVTLTVLDSFGNASTCNAWVTVIDTLNPTAVCASPTIYLNNTGTATLYPSELSAGSSDNCSVVDSFVNIVGNTFTTFNCSAIFTPQAATLIVQDGAGNTASCPTTVNVVDTVSPVALCEYKITAQLDALGVATVFPSAIDSNSIDNCGLVEYTIDGVGSVTYNCSDLGLQTAILEVRDSSGNTATCSANVEVQDNIAPNVSCQTTNAYLNASGIANIVPTDVLVLAGTSDNCGVASTNFSTGGFITYNCDSIGTRSVTVIVNDFYGNSSNCVTTVTVLDTVPPAANCRPVPYSLSLDSTGNGCITPMDVDNGSSDLCSIDTMLVGGVDSLCYNCTDLGSNLVTLSVLDSSGNQSTCQATVIVEDDINPTAACHDTFVYLNNVGIATVLPSEIDAGSSDNCSFNTSINGLGIKLYTCSSVGTNTVQLIVTDGSGNVSQCPANITVLDTISPTANCIAPATYNVYLDSSCFASIPATVLNSGSNDNCFLGSSSYTVNGLPNVTFNSSNLSSNPNALTLTVSDPNGNVTTCNTSVIVRDTISPSVICQSDTVQLDAFGNATVLPSTILAGGGDNCSGTLNYTLNGQPSVTFDCTDLGDNTVTLTASDSSGNSSSCVTTVFVEDDVAPVASCTPSVSLDLVVGGNYGVLTAPMMNSGSSDNCGIVSYTLSRDTFNCADIFANPHTVTMVVADATGNLDSCTSQINVQDVTPPTAACQSATVYLSAGAVNVTPAAVLVTPTGDNCTTLSSTFTGIGSNIVYTCDSIGPHNVQVTVTDISGNTATCNTLINVVDTTSPNAICNTLPHTVQLDNSGTGCVYPSDVDNGSFDFCGISDFKVNGLDSFCYTCANLGATAVTLSVLDHSGNQSTCTANITVNDPINPVAQCHDTTLYLSPAGFVTVTPQMIDDGSTDNCSISTLINGFSSINYSCSQVGTNTAQLVVEDASGNTTQCAASITVLDTISPTANCIGNGQVTVYLDNTCFATVPSSTFNNGSYDNCNSTLNYYVGGLPNATFNASNIATNPNSVTLVVRDASGNFSTCTTTVIVSDTTAPFVACTPDTVQLTTPSTIINPNQINGGTSDNCSVPTLSINGQPSITLDCSNLGTNTVTLIATDYDGNQDSCSTTVFLEDVAPPTANCNATSTIYLDPSSNVATLQTADLDNNSSDNCSITNYTLSQQTFNCSYVLSSPHPVQLLVTDQSGNQDSCITQVYVEDTIPPVAICQDDTLFFAGAPITITSADLDAGSYDNCAIQSISISKNTFNCPDIGVNPVTLTVIDSSGNVDSCIANVLLIDTAAQSIPGPMQVLCTQDSTYLAANSVSGGLTGTWYTSSGATIANPNDPNTLVTNIPPGANVFYWQLSNATCANLSTDSVTIHMILPSPDSAIAGINQNLCEATAISLTANTPSVSTARWLQDAAQIAAGVNIIDTLDPATTVTNLVPGNTYHFVWEFTNSLCGVHSLDTVQIHIDYVPSDIANAGPNQICSPDTVMMQATASPFGTGVWTTPTTATFADSSAPTSMANNFVQDTSMMVWTLSNGTCVDYSADTMYIILDAEWPDVAWDSFGIVPDGQTTIIDVISNDTLPDSWNISLYSEPDTGSVINLYDGTFDVDINQTKVNQYIIYEVCNAVCYFVCDTAHVTLAVLPSDGCYIPTAFTPNNDGSNDYFEIPCLGNIDEKASLLIFNRWGYLVFETDNYDSDWDGTHKGQPLPDGTYFYILQIEGERPQQGSIEVKR